MVKPNMRRKFFRIVGAKTYLTEKALLPNLPPNWESYVWRNPFLGSGVVEFIIWKVTGITPVMRICNDYNQGIASAFYCLSRPVLFFALSNICYFSMHSQGIYNQYCKLVEEFPRLNFTSMSDDDRLERAAAAMITCHYAINGKQGDTFFRHPKLHDKKNPRRRHVFDMNTFWDYRECYEQSQFFDEDFLPFLRRTENKQTTFTYLDPPYMVTALRKDYYKHCLTLAQQESLAQYLLDECQGLWLLSIDAHPETFRVYDLERKDGKIVCGRKGVYVQEVKITYFTRVQENFETTELLISNYPPPRPGQTRLTFKQELAPNNLDQFFPEITDEELEV